MQRFKYSILAAVGILVLSSVLIAIGPKRVMAALGYTPVRDVDGPARQPFSIQPDVTAGTAFNYTVPNNKRLVVTYVDSGEAGSTALDVELVTTVNGQPSETIVPYGTVVAGFHYANQEVTAYADPGTTMRVYYATTGGTPTARINVHGYFVDVP